MNKGGVQSCSDLPVGEPPPPFLFCSMFLSTHPHSLGSDMHVNSLKPPSISDGSLALVFPIHFAQGRVPVCENKGQIQRVRGSERQTERTSGHQEFYPPQREVGSN